jgi:5-methylcytosine-specific restriction endonuclease McrA
VIPTEQLQRLVLEVAVTRYGNGTFTRVDLRKVVEEHLRAHGMWSFGDDSASQSTDPKSIGQANIDFRISDLSRLGLITSQSWNHWRVGSHSEVDEDDSPPNRIPTTILRTVRDTALARLIKSQCRFLCQVCQTPLAKPDGTLYVEAHHVRPLSRRHNGADTADNIIVLCPNHHALFDLGVPEFLTSNVVRIGNKVVTLTPEPGLSQMNIDYHNSEMRSPLDGQALGGTMGVVFDI